MVKELESGILKWEFCLDLKLLSMVFPSIVEVDERMEGEVSVFKHGWLTTSFFVTVKHWNIYCNYLWAVIKHVFHKWGWNCENSEMRRLMKKIMVAGIVSLGWKSHCLLNPRSVFLVRKKETGERSKVSRFEHVCQITNAINVEMLGWKQIIGDRW